MTKITNKFMFSSAMKSLGIILITWNETANRFNHSTVNFHPLCILFNEKAIKERKKKEKEKFAFWQHFRRREDYYEKNGEVTVGSGARSRWTTPLYGWIKVMNKHSAYD